jgi:hypothetical protein
MKGQMVACEPAADVLLPTALIWGEGVYLVPQRGRLLVGATVEDVGFDTSVSREACERLIGAAARVIPALGNWRIAEMWAGYARVPPMIAGARCERDSRSLHRERTIPKWHLVRAGGLRMHWPVQFWTTFPPPYRRRSIHRDLRIHPKTAEIVMDFALHPRLAAGHDVRRRLESVARASDE